MEKSKENVMEPIPINPELNKSNNIDIEPSERKNISETKNAFPKEKLFSIFQVSLPLKLANAVIALSEGACRSPEELIAFIVEKDLKELLQSKDLEYILEYFKKPLQKFYETMQSPK